MKGLILIFVASLALTCYGQQPPENPNVTDAKGRRQGTWTVWYTKQDNQTTNADSLSYYRILNYKNDKPVGKVKDYYLTGELQGECTLLADRPEDVCDGIATAYRKSGVKKAVAEFNRGTIVKLTYYDVNGVETTESLEALTIQGVSLMSEGYYELSLAKLEGAYALLQKGEGEDDDQDHAEVLSYLGLCHQYLGNLAKARPFLLEAVGWAAKGYGTNKTGYGKALNSLALLYVATGELSKAEPLLLKAKQIYGPAILANPDMYSTFYATILNNLAMVYLSAGKFEKAEPFMIEAMKTYSNTTDANQKHLYANSLNNLATLYAKAGQYKKADTLYHRSKDIYENSFGKQNPFYANTLFLIGGLYQVTGNYSAAEAAYVEAQPILVKFLGKDNPNIALIYDMRGQLYEGLANFRKAEELFREALRLTEKSLGKDHINYALYVNDLGTLYGLLGNYAQAEASYKEAISIIRKNATGHDLDNFPTLESATLENLGNLYQGLGDYSKAERYYLDAQASLAKIYGKAHAQYAIGLANLGKLYQTMGNYTQAEKLLVEASRTMANAMGTNHPEYAVTLNNLAALYNAMDQSSKSEPLLRQALSIAERQLGKNNPDYALYLENLAVLYAGSYEIAKAEPLLIEARENWRRNLGKGAKYAVATRNLASLYISKGELPRADSLLAESLGIVNATLGPSHPTYATVLHEQATLNERQGKTAAARQLYLAVDDNSLRQVENFFPTLSESEKDGFYKTLRTRFDRFNAFCVKHAKSDPSLAGDMFNLQLATKAILLNSAAKWKQRIKSSGDRKLFSLYSDWESNQVVLARMYKDPSTGTRGKLDSMETVTNAIEKELSRRSEMFSSVADKKRRSWQEVKSKLKPGEVAIELIRVRTYGIRKTATDSSDVRKTTYPVYELTDSVYYAALAVSSTSNIPEITLLRNGNDLEGKYLHSYRNQIKSELQDHDSYTQYWAPILDLIRRTAGAGNPTIFLSPDGVYDLINLNTLWNPSTGKYLLEESNITLITSTKDLLAEHKDEAFNNLAYLFGYPNYGASTEDRTKQIEQIRDAQPSYYNLIVERGATLEELPGTRTEVEQIAKLMDGKGWEVNTLTGDKALEETLKDCFKPRVLHIATHGFFNSDSLSLQNPLIRSGLMLTGAGQTLQGKKDDTHDDGILTAYEAMNLNLDNTDLVVLSACETGLGDVRNGEGVYGLQRAFKVAGAKTLVMSLWKVNDDATQELMVEFYQAWLTSGDKVKSFRAAQQKLKTKYKTPYYWGAFIMVGE